MKVRKTSNSNKTSKGKPIGTRIGRKAFAAISAVEGIRLTPEMKRRTAEFDRRGLSEEERRRIIIRAYLKG
jgi:hypothetical protein